MHGPQQLLTFLAKATPFRDAARLRELPEAPRGDADAARQQLTARMRAGMRSRLDAAARGDAARARRMFDRIRRRRTSPPRRCGSRSRSFPRDDARGASARDSPRPAARRSPSRCIPPSRSSSVRRDRVPARGAHGARRLDASRRPGATTRCGARQDHDDAHARSRSTRSACARWRASAREMDKVIASTGFKGTFAEFLAVPAHGPALLLQDARGRASRPIATSPSAPTRSCRSSSPSCRACPTASAPMEAYEGDNADHYSRRRARRQPRRLLRGQREQPREAARRTRWRPRCCTRRCPATTCRSRAPRS